MGKKLVIHGADFFENRIRIPAIIDIKAGTSLTLDGVTYSAGSEDREYELDSFPEVKLPANDSLKKIIIDSDSLVFPQEYCDQCSAIEEIIVNAAGYGSSIAWIARNSTSLKRLVVKGGSYNNLYGVYQDCNSIEYVDLKGADLSRVYNMENFLNYCTSLKKIELPEATFDRVSVAKFAFRHLKSCEKIDLHAATFSTCSNFMAMFASSSYTDDPEPSGIKEIDLSSFNPDISSNPDKTSMFFRLMNLHTVWVDNCTDAVKAWLLEALNTDPYAPGGNSSSANGIPFSETTIRGRKALHREL